MSVTPSASGNDSSTIGDLSIPEGSLYTDFSSDAKPQIDVVVSQLSDVKADPEPATTSESIVPKEDKGKQESKDKAKEQTNKRPNRKDWIDIDNPLHCKPCEIIAKNMQEFQDHSLSYKHIKKTAEVLEMKVNPKKNEEKKQPVSFACEVCVCACNSESAWNSHLLGQKHRKNLEKQGAARMFQKQKMKYGGAVGSTLGPVYNAQLSHGSKPYQKTPWQGTASPGTHCANDFAQYKEPLIGLEYVTEIQVTGQNPRYHCKLCDAKFDHNVKFPHLVGAKHRFNVLKEKSPSVAQEIRVGVKKRSQLTGKLLEEALKIELEEGRQQVKTCVEASPFETATTSFVPSAKKPLMSQGRGRGNQPRGMPGHSIKGTSPHPGKMKKNPNINMPFQSHGGNVSNYGYGRAQGRGQQHQGGGIRGRGGGRGRGRGRGNSSNYGGGYIQQSQLPYHQLHVPYNFAAQNQGYHQFQSSSQFEPGPLLPQEAFRPRSPPRSPPSYGSNTPYNYSATRNQHNYQIPPPQDYGPSGIQTKTWNQPPAESLLPKASTTPKAEPQPSSTPASTDSTKQNLLQNLTDLGKLVNSEEDASIALQVSNALTQALLNYRMQNLD